MHTCNKICASFLKFFIIPIPFFINSVLAANLTVSGVAPRAESMQAFTAVADDPSAVYYNPAGLTQLKGTHIDQGVMGIFPDGTYTNSINGVSTTTTKVAVGGDLFISSDKLAPLIVGFGVYSPFSRVTGFDPNAAVGNMLQNTRLLKLDFVPTIAYALNSNISVGASVVGSRVSISSNVLGLDEFGIGYGATGQAGILVNLPPSIKIGVDYRAPMNTRITGNGGIQGLGTGSFVSHFKFPGTLTGGVSWQVSNPLLVTAEYDYEMWSYLNSIVRVYNNPVLNNPFTANIINAKNVGDIRVGLDYHWTKANELLAGYSYLPQAVPSNNIIPSKGDYDQHNFSAGYSYYYKNLRLDAGYELSYLPAHGSNGVLPGTYQMWVNTVMLGLGITIA